MEQQLCLFRGQNEAIFKNKQQRKNTSKSVHLKYI